MVEMSGSSLAGEQSVLRCADMSRAVLEALLARYGMRLCWVAAGEPIPGSFWGDSEAGLVGDSLYVRHETPLHSLLHEACHYICMDGTRRASLHTDAAGGYDEENGVCYLQILLADELPGLGRARLMADMDAWGYSFRLGSAERWFAEDAEDARTWLQTHGVIDVLAAPTWRLRD